MGSSIAASLHAWQHLHTTGTAYREPALHYSTKAYCLALGPVLSCQNCHAETTPLEPAACIAQLPQ